MSSLNELKRRLKHRFGHRDSESISSKHLPEAVDQTIQHHYEHRQQPVIFRENHNVEVKQIIQPIEDEEEIEHEHQEFARAFAYKEQLHDMSLRQVEIRDQNRKRMNLTRHHTLADTHNTVSLEPMVEEICFNHVIEEIQPLLKQKRYHRHVLTEYIPIFEKHMHVSNVTELTTAAPIYKSEWDPKTSQTHPNHRQPIMDQTVANPIFENGDRATKENHNAHSCMATQLISSDD